MLESSLRVLDLEEQHGTLGYHDLVITVVRLEDEVGVEDEDEEELRRKQWEVEKGDALAV